MIREHGFGPIRSIFELGRRFGLRPSANAALSCYGAPSVTKARGNGANKLNIMKYYTLNQVCTALHIAILGTVIQTLCLAADGAVDPRGAAGNSGERTIIVSAVGAKLDSNVHRGGGTDQTDLIQGLLDRAPKLGSLRLIVDGPMLVRGLRIHSNTTIECLNRDCGFFLADGSDQHIIRNANQKASGRDDRNISFIGGTYNGNALKQKKTDPTLGWISAFSLHGVEQLLFRDVSITDMRTFAIHLSNWRRAVFENVYINLGQIPESSNQDGIHVQGPGEFLSMRNIQGRTWDDMIALNADDTNVDWDLNRKFVRNSVYGPYASNGPITDVDIDGVQAEDCAQVIRLLSRESRIDRVSIRNVRGTYRTFGVWMSSFYREGGNFGRVELENIDLRAAAPNAYEYLPPFLLYLAGKIEHVSVRNIINYLPIDDRPLVWIAPDAKIDYLGIRGLQVFDQRLNYGNGPIIRADGDVRLLQIKDVVVQRPQGKAPAGALLATGLPREDIKKNLERRFVAGYIKKDSARNTWGWPEAYGYLDRPGRIGQLIIEDIIAERLAHIVDHQLGAIERLHVLNIVSNDVGHEVVRGPKAAIVQTSGTH